jgi:hypothetical protein
MPANSRPHALLALLASMTAAFAIAACGGGGSTGAAPATDASTGTGPGPTSDAGAASDGSPSDPARDGAPSDAAPAPIAVHGAVRDGLHLGVSGYTVLLGDDRTATTGADGTFTFDGVTPPYTLAVGRLDGGSIELFDGLTVPELELSGFDPSRSGTNDEPLGVKGLPGFAYAFIEIPPMQTSEFAFLSGDPAFVADAYVPATTAAAHLEVAWRGTAPLAGTFWTSLTRCSSDGACDALDLDVSSTAVTLTPGSTVVPVPVITTLSGRHSLTVLETGLSCSKFFNASVNYVGAGVLVADVVRNFLATPGPTFTVPDAPPGLSLALGVVCDDGDTEAMLTGLPLAAGDGTAPFTLFAAPTVTAPLDGATIAWPPSAAWTAAPGASGVFTLALDSSSKPFELTVRTARTSFAVPSLSAFGFAPQSGDAFNWLVFQDARAPSVDALVAPGPRSQVGVIAIPKHERKLTVK